MHRFHGLVYLDVHKTGSSYVSAFLEACCSGRPGRLEKHQPVSRGEHNPADLHVISVRQPQDQYLSLFRYGLDGRGHVYKLLKGAGLGFLYERADEVGFADFVAFILDPSRSVALNQDYPWQARRLGIGLMTWRHLSLALASPHRTLGFDWPLARFNPWSGQRRLIDFYRQRNIVDFVLRQESLSEDLHRLSVQVRPDLFDQNSVVRFLSETARMNCATAGAYSGWRLPDHLHEEVRRAEWLLFEEFYPDDR